MRLHSFPPPRSNVSRRHIRRVTGGQISTRMDRIIVEEPMEIRIRLFGVPEPISVGVTMRTPGHDFELAAGWLFAEGILHSPDEVSHLTYCTDPHVDHEQRYNIVNVHLRPGIRPNLNRPRRRFAAMSGCGVCGTASLASLRAQGVAPAESRIRLRAALLPRMGEVFRQSQRLFQQTGGLHAAALFDEEGRLLSIREDVGRHNAVDKLIGQAWLDRQCPLERNILMVSSRAGFEIVQKAAVAGVPILITMSAPSTLACDTASAFGITLIGFARGDSFNVYTGEERVWLETVEQTEGE
jgi:FdhD protein